MTDQEWVTWDEMRRLLTAVDVSWYHEPKSWAAQGLVETRARVFTGGGVVIRDKPIARDVWREVMGGRANFDGISGSLRARMANGDGDNGQVSWTGIMFKREQVEGLLPRIPSLQEVKAPGIAAADTRGSEKRRSRAGRKPEMDRWDSFWLSVVQLASEGRLSNFSSQSELSEEIALLMGEGAFSPDHMAPRVAQVFRKYCEAN